MCGIVGWVDFARDARDRTDLLHRLTDTIAHRGPDQDGYFTDRHVALGHRRLSIVDLDGSRQPMVAVEDGRPVAVIVYKSEVYNYRELRAELALAGRRCEGEGDTEVVLQAYLQWGPDFVDRLNGIYAFAIWDARTEELLLVRDRIGVKPLYYAPTPDGVVFASEPKAILAYPGFEAVVDTDGLRELLSVVKSSGHAVYRGMAEVPPGHVVTVSRAGIRTRCYWRLTAAEHTDDLDTTVVRIRALLDDIVARQLVADVPVAMLLSGGLDSSAIAALAARQLAAVGAGPLRTFSVDFVGYLDAFRPDQLRDQPDAPFVAEFVAHAGTDHTGLVLSTVDLADAAHRRAALHACDLPNGRGDRDTSLMLLFRAVAAHARVVLSGESADELFGGYRWFHDADAVASDSFGWLAMFGHPADDGPGSATSLLDPLLLKQLDMPAYRQAQYATALAEVPHVEGADTTERRMREICYLHLTRMMPVLLDRAERMAAVAPVEARIPFVDHRLVEYVFGTPWAMKTFDGREKSLLRAAVADVLPASILARRKAPYPATQDTGYEAWLRGELAALAADPAAPVAPLLHTRRIGEVLEGGAPAGSSNEGRSTIELVLRLNDWLGTYGIRLDLR